MSFYDDASLIMYPSGYKEDKIYSLKPTDGSGDLTFTRASTATRVNAEGLIETSPVNLVQYSEDFNNAFYTKVEATVNSNTTTAPNGTTTADSLLDTTTNFIHALTPLTSKAEEPTTFTFSVYAKFKDANRKIALSFDDAISGGCGSGVFNLLTGVFDSAIEVPSAGFTNPIRSSENVGNGWYRLIFTITSNSASSIRSNIFVADNSNNQFYAGNGTGIFIWGAQLNIGATAKPYFPTTDRLNVPRIDYTGGGCGKLLLEPQSTNLLQYSEQFDNVYWLKFVTSITANTTTSPDGTQNADSLISDSGQYGVLYIAAQFTAGQNVTLSIFAKANTSSTIRLGTTDAGIDYNGVFNLSNGTITSSTGVTASIQSMGNGWYRCIVNRTMAGSANIFVVEQEGGKSLYIWGAQAEASSYPTSYIPCPSSSSVTRLADSASKSGISSLIGQTEGTMFLELDIIAGSPVYHTLMQIYGDDNNRIAIGQDINNTNVFMYINANGTVSYQVVTTPAGHYKIALAYKNEDSVLYINGLAAITNSRTITLATSLNTLFLNNLFGNEIGIFKNYQSILFKTRLTNDQLADLTGGNKTTFNSLATFYGYTIL